MGEMSTNETATASYTYSVVDSNVPEVTASLEMLSVTSCESSNAMDSKRVLRKRIPKPNSENLNRRCNLRPKKISWMNVEVNNIKEYYLDKNIKRAPHTFETIYEEENETAEETCSMSLKRFQRVIQFQKEPSIAKIKKRKAKVKRLFGNNMLAAINRIKRQKARLSTILKETDNS